MKQFVFYAGISMENVTRKDDGNEKRKILSDFTNNLALCGDKVYAKKSFCDRIELTL